MAAGHVGEKRLIPIVEAFGRKHFPDCIMVYHPAVFFDEDTLVPFSNRDEAVRILTGKRSGKVGSCEVIPDYAFFEKKDVVGMRFRHSNKWELRCEAKPDDAAFEEQRLQTSPRTYIRHAEPQGKAWKNRRCVLLLRPNAKALAVVDHKGGKTHNVRKQRLKVLYQGQRFGTQNCYIIIPCDAPEPMNIRTRIPMDRVMPDLQRAEVYRIVKTLT